MRRRPLVRPRSPGARSYASLGAQRYLWAMSQERDPDSLELALTRLRELDRRRGSQLFRTLEAYLDRQGNAQQAAATLYIHRNTLRQRLRRMREVIGLDPDRSGVAGSSSSFAVRLIRFRELRPGTPGDPVAASPGTRVPARPERHPAWHGPHVPGTELCSCTLAPAEWPSWQAARACPTSSCRAWRAEFSFLSQEDVDRGGRAGHGRVPRDDRGDARPPPPRLDALRPQKAALHWTDELDTDEKHGRIMAMPAYVGGSLRMAGMKWIPSVPQNPARGLPARDRDHPALRPRHRAPGLRSSTARSSRRCGRARSRASPRGPSLSRDASTLPLYRRRACRRERSCSRSSGRFPTSPRSASYDPTRRRRGRFVEREQPGRPPIRVLDDAARGRVRRGRRRRGDDGPGSVHRAADWFEPGQLADLRVVARPGGRRRRVQPTSSSPTTSTTRPSIHRDRSPGLRPPACSPGTTVVPLGAILAGDHPGRTGPDERDPRLARRAGDRGRRLGDGRLPTRASSSGSDTPRAALDAPIWT